MGSYAIINRGRGPELAGTRITVFNVIPYLEAGDSPTYIASALNLSTAQVETLIQYIDQHKDEVMAENQKIVERIARGNPPEIEKRLEASPVHHLVQARWKEIQEKRAREEVNGASDPE